MLPAVYIDDTGEPWRGSDQSVLPLGASSKVASVRFEHRIVDALGFVHIAPMNSAGQIVTLNRKVVLPIALAGAIRWLADHRSPRVILRDTTASNNATTASVPVIQSNSQAIKELGLICDERTSVPRFQRRPIRIESSYFSTRWEAAKEILNAGLDLDVQSHILDKLFQQHFVLTERDPSSGHFLLTDAGINVERHMDNIGELQIGQPFLTLKDSQFGQWIAQGLRDFSVADRPVTEALEIRVQTGVRGQRTVRYARLVIPFVRSGRDHLFTAAVIETS